MKKLLLFLSFIGFFASLTNAQCPNNNSSAFCPTLDASTLTVGNRVNICTTVWGGEYQAVDNIVAGNTYTVDLCAIGANSAPAYDSYLTIYTATGTLVTFNDNFCGDDGQVTFVAPVSGSYRLLADQGAGCSSNASNTNVNITLDAVGCVNPTTPTVSASPTTICPGNSSTLTITGTLNGATHWAVYSSSCGGTLLGTTTTSSFVVSPAVNTTYFVRGEGGCVTPGSCGSTTINVSAVSLTASSQTNISCNGGSNGAAAVNAATGGAGGYTYNWTPGNPTGDGTTSVTGLTAGTWTCTVTDANACTAAVNFTVTQPTALSLTASSQTNISCNGGSNGAAAVNAATGGAGGYTYNWTPGNPTGDGTTSVTGLTAGTWTCTVTDANACTAAVNFTVTQPTALSLTASSQTNISCNGGSNGAAAVNAATGGAGGYTYNWTPGNPTGDGTTSVTGLTASTWTCTVTDANACTAAVNFTVTQPTALSLTASSQTNISCNGGSNGAAAVNAATGGAGGYTYNWTPGNPTGDGTTSVTGLTAGTWTCTVTDANSCTAAVNFTVTQPTALSLTASSQTNISCNGGSNGAAAVNAATGGAGGYTYNWTPGNPTGDGTTSVTGLTAGTWTCTVTDANSCTAAVNFTVTQPSALSATINSTSTSCSSNTGTATVSAVTGGAGGYTYNWTPGNPTGDGTTSVSGLSAGVWTCTITDANGCTLVRNTTVSTISGPSLTALSQTNISCNGGSNGAAAVNTATGGTPGYTYNWTPGNPTGDGTTSVSGLTSGTWTCTVTDASGCTAAVNFTLTQPTALSLTANSQTNIACNGESTGAAAVNTATGGAGGYTYNWTPGNPTGDGTTSVTGLSAGTWTCTVTDANSCITSQNFTITEPITALTASSTSTSILCNGGTSDVTVTATGGTAPYTGEGTFIETAGSYSYTVTDNNGCTAVTNISITEPTALTASSSATSILCNGGTSDVTVTATGGTAPYTGEGTFTETAGSYSYTVTDNNGCTAVTNISITEPTALTASSSATSILCNGGTSDVTVTATGGTAPYTGEGTFTETAGSYSYTVTDNNGCTAVTNISVTEPNAIALTQNITICFGETFTVGSNVYSTDGNYTDVLTALNGCDSTVTTNLTVNAAIDVTTSLNGITITATNTTGTYQWIDCNNGNAILSSETGQSYTASANGDYAVIVTENSCSDTSACVNINSVGISENNFGSSVSIYPNPTTGSITIEFSKPNQEVMVRVTNVTGQLIEQKTVYSSENLNYQLTGERGFYFIELTNNYSEKTVIKVVKQ